MLRLIIGGFLVLALSLVTVSEVTAQSRATQSRVVVPVIVQPPAATTGASGGTTGTRVIVQGRPGAGTTSGAPGQPMGFFASPTTSRNIRVFIHGNQGVTGGPPTAPNVSGTGSTVTVTEPGAGTRSFGRSPQTSQEIRVFVHDRTGTPADPLGPRAFFASSTGSRTIRIFVDGAAVEVPIVILTE